MKIRILQHSKGTPPGTVIDWMQMKGHDSTLVRLFEGEPLPDLDQTDWLILLGGPMNVDQYAEHPWLKEERAYLEKAIAQGKTCLGLCLGGQLLARALGAEVHKHKYTEVGWFPVEIASLGIGESDVTKPENRTILDVFQWHEDTFDLPRGATLIATNEATTNQGFAYSDHVIGLQFHPESTAAWVRECAEDDDQPAPGPYVQTPEQMIAGLDRLPSMKSWFFRLLDQLEAKTAARLRRR